jgi:16S rRNA (guanine1516-N2)-methyltransferase
MEDISKAGSGARCNDFSRNPGKDLSKDLSRAAAADSQDGSIDAEARAAEVASRAGLRLFYDESGLALEGDGMVLRGDFAQMLSRLKPHNLQRDLLVRACRVKLPEVELASNAGPKNASEVAGVAGSMNQTASEYAGRPIHVLDATAGLGEDSLLLAAAGFQVTMFESDPVIAALLRDAMRRAGEHPVLVEVVRRMRLVEADSMEAMRTAGNQLEGINHSDGICRPDVVYLDPMFPERQKSGLIKKKFQLLQRLELPCAEENEMLEAALASRPRRIVIKRPLKGPVLAGFKPTFVIKGKAIRYDCITP